MYLIINKKSPHRDVTEQTVMFLTSVSQDIFLKKFLPKYVSQEHHLEYHFKQEPLVKISEF